MRNLWLARRAKKHGANYSLRIILEARRAGIPISLGFALIEQESNFRNVFGHDPTDSIPDRWKGTKVTKDKYQYYKRRRGRHGMQGVGPAQLTWYEYQDRADRLGGCWVPRHNIRVGFEIIAAYYKSFKRQDKSTREAIRLAGQKYNGSVAYGHSLLAKYDRWHRIFNR